MESEQSGRASVQIEYVRACVRRCTQNLRALVDDQGREVLAQRESPSLDAAVDTERSVGPFECKRPYTAAREVVRLAGVPLDEDLTPGRQREHPEQETAGVQARIERDQNRTATKLEGERTDRAIDLAERRGEERGRLDVILQGIRADITELFRMSRSTTGDLVSIKEVLLRSEATADAERAATAEYRKERERKEDRAQPWKIALLSALVSVLLVVLGAVVAHFFT